MTDCGVAALQLSPSQLVGLITSPALFVAPSSKITAANPAMFAFLGKELELILGRDISDYVPALERQAVGRFITSCMSAISEEALSKPLETKFGAQADSVLIQPILKGSREVAGFLVQTNNAEIFSENRLWRNAVTSGKLGVWERDFRLKDAKTTSSWWQLRGFDPEHQTPFTFNEWLERVHPDDRHQFDKDAKSVWRIPDGAFVELRYRELNQQGDWIWIFSRSQILQRDEKGQAQIVAGVDVDITDSVLAEKERLELVERLNRVERLDTTGTLTGGIAHDFNNLLAVVSGSAELLEFDLGRSDERLIHILNAVNRGAELTQSLLSFSRKQTLTPVSIDVSEFTDRFDDILKRIIPERNEVEMHCGTGVWNCKADRDQLESALINLAVNACDAMKIGGRVLISAENITLEYGDAEKHSDVSPGEYVLFTVKDSGEGMSEGEMRRAFEPFFTTKTVGVGTGLGLSMVFGFAKQSNGHVTLNSTPGEGSVVQLYIPRASSQDESTKQIKKETATLEAVRDVVARVVMVEDEEIIRSITMNYLENKGYQVRSFATADEALESFLVDDNVDVLLSDLVLPGKLNGVQLAVEMRKRKADVAVVFMSGYTSEKNSGLNASQIDSVYLRKPFAFQDLLEKITEVL